MASKDRYPEGSLRTFERAEPSRDALRVPSRRGDDYTLSELWEPFASAIREAAKKLAMDAPAVRAIGRDVLLSPSGCTGSSTHTADARGSSGPVARRRPAIMGPRAARPNSNPLAVDQEHP